MSKFNEIFAIVQKQCKEKGEVSGTEELQNIATNAGITFDKLEFYLDCIQMTGVMFYSASKKTIRLTEKGLSAMRIFP